MAGLGLLSLLIFIPIVSSIIIYLLGRVRTEASRYFALAVSLLVLVLAIVIFAEFSSTDTILNSRFLENITWAPSLGLTYLLSVDGISLPLILVSAFLTALVVAGSFHQIHEKEPAYYALLMIFEGAIMGVFTSVNLILFFVFWELVLIPMFFFIGVWGGPRRRYAAMKFIIYTTAGSVVMLLGFVALYFNLPLGGVVRPTFDLPGIWELMANPNALSQTVKLLVTGAVFFGFAVKLPVVPFHTWLPDAHVEAPAPISVLLAGLLLKMGGYGFIRISLTLFPDITHIVSPVYITLGLISIIYAGVVATIQDDLKRLIALTSINHMGYVLVGAYTALPIGIAGSVFQMFNHACAIGLLFLLTGVLHDNAGTRLVSQLRGLRVGMPLTSGLLAVGSFAAIGMPGLSNFLSEFMVITGAVQFNWILAVILLGPAITAGYFMWMMNRVLFSQPASDSTMHESPRLDLIVLACFLIPVFILGVYPAPMLDKINPAVQFLIHNILGK